MTSWDDDDDWEYEPQYQALGMLFGLTEDQARDFMITITTVENLYWYSLNQYYNTETGRYDLTVKDLDWLAPSEIEAIEKLTGIFKK